MFDSERREILERKGRSEWSPGDGHLAYLEAWEDGDFEEVQIFSGPLEDSEVDEWLRQRGKFSSAGRQSRPRAQVRILLCERLHFRPLRFAMSRKSFLSVEHAIGLTSMSLPILNGNTGTQHAHLKFKKNLSGRPLTSLESLVMTIKQPQMFQLGNLGMAMSHHFETRTTLAFIHGWDIFSDKSEITKQPIVPHIEAIQEILKSSRRLLPHPLLLPVMILRRHLTRAEIMRRQLSSATEKIEDAIGVTQTARLSGRTVQDQRIVEEVKAMVLGETPRIHTTARISTTVTDVINMKGTLEWDEAYVKFLRRVNDDVKAHRREPHTTSEADLELCGFIDLLERDAQSISSYATRMQSRLDLQFNVLYNLIAQAGNSLNMQQSTQAGQVAAQAGMDSTAMKTMAVVTMVFLPPTFTIFSMSFFNWQASSSSGDDGGAEPTVVPQFWIYWAVSLPLTIAIVIGWRVWWHFQKAYYETKFLRPEKHQDYEDKSRSKSRDRSREMSRDRTHDPRRRRSRYQV
ncbi:uncharacterized protein BDZ83DRAFT_587293 [Colletotrichum acutatum]|uniref:Uncharacterized protein n=1 Tax=Glomerella acutata TaxID=27357 RepID=A0AAD8UF24_GLOAC|nr:uncharacterized protein BDZ83DRAFT_587293 [Colletotrichum acutatum]KAK1716670.1 hypothetical protein BDZ83DRAFT_587293 [Colletotrichum acutatum]